MKKRLLAVLLAFTLLGATACGNTADDNGTSEDGKSSGEVQKIRVLGLSNSDGVSYFDDDGNLTGYEVEVLRAVDELLPQYEFEFNTTSDFATILLSIDEGKADLAYGQYEKNEEREEKYLFNQESHLNFPLRIVVLQEDTHDYKTLADLAGKKIWVIPATNAAYLCEQWNADHPDQQIVLEYSTDTSTLDTELRSGALDAFLSIERSINMFNKLFNLGYKVVGDTLNEAKCYFISGKENKELLDAIDTAILQLKKDGTLSELSNKFLDGDYVE